MSTEHESSNFIRDVILADNASGKWGGKVVTRFPPEPNGYLHIGHAKAICINFGLAAEFGGQTHLRYDDTNPTKEEVEYVEAIQRDIKWLGFDWGEHLYWASDYFERMAEDARTLIRKGLAYVDESTLEELRAQRGTVTEPGVNSPYRDRPIAESLELFEEMLTGGIAEGGAVLRAKIDMANPNMKMRDPPFYRVLHATHHHVGDRWKAYPLYDYAHCLEDSYEGVTHSLCSLEFENNRELYDWYLDKLEVEHHSRQYEFARLAMTHTMMSKRKLRALVEEGIVDGWDDPRMPTLSALRRRGVRPEAVRAFIASLGVAKTNSVFPYERFDAAIRDDLEAIAPRVMGVVDPVRLIIENLDDAWEIELPHHPKADLGTRTVPFSNELFIERSDFAEEPPKKWKRLAPGWEVRLRGACFVTCTGVDKAEDGTITAVRCTWDPATRGGDAPDGRRPKGTIHWVDARAGEPVTIRLYDRLFAAENPDEGDFHANLNPDSLRVTRGVVEPAALGLERVQFERTGFFIRDPKGDGFNRIVGLRDSFKAKPAKAPKASKAPKKTPKKAPAKPAKAAELTAVEEALLAEAGTDAARALILNDVRRAVGGPAEEALPFDGSALAAILGLVDGGTLARGAVGKVMAVLVTEGGDPAAIVQRLGITKVSDASELVGLVDATLAMFPDELARYRGGEARLMGFFMGQVMRASKGAADAKTVSALLRERLLG